MELVTDPKLFLYLEKLNMESPALPQNRVINKNHWTSPMVPLTIFVVFRTTQ
ncbi:hypothetical protein LguiA_001097 [Lonicera macranthoides]